MHEAANIVNSRPLTVATLNDPTSEIPLCPNQLLTMKSGVILALPGEFRSADGYCRKRWRRVQYLANIFWERWKKEFLSELQQRVKWCKSKRNLQIGDIVLILDEHIPRTQWKVGKIVETLLSSDGLVRNVKIQLGDSKLSDKGKRIQKLSFLERPFHKLILLLENE